MESTAKTTTREEDVAPNAVVLKALDELIEQKFPNSKFTYDIEKATEKGDNYLGVVYRIIAHIKSQHGEEETYKIILKVPPENPMRRLMLALKSFHNEAFAYEDFLRLVEDFQRSKGLSEQEMFLGFPKCYKIMREEFNECIFLEDLGVSGYRMFDRFKLIDTKHVSKVMKAYGQLHAVSFALKDQEPEKFAKYREIKDIFSDSDEMFVGFLESLKGRSLNALTDDKDSHYKQKLAEYYKKSLFMDNLLTLLNGKESEPYSVVCHGDCWNNNILFQYNEVDDNEPLNAKLLDWQIMRYATPISDIMYFLFSSTTGDFRKLHYNDMLDVYYKSLAEHLSRLGSDHEKLFPRSAFDEELKSKGILGLLLATMVLPAIVTPPKDAPDMNAVAELVESKPMEKLKELDQTMWFSEASQRTFNQRVRDVIRDCIVYGYMDK